jgi:HD superfamily phosphohydrolase
LIAPSKGQEGFLYHIVANQVNHLDVDKMEYIKRDARACGLSSGGFDTDTMRIINAARVIDGHICYHKKVYEDIYNLFQTRYRLHTTVYRHPVVVAIHHMVADALRASDIPLEQSIETLSTFYKFDDGILDQLRHNNDVAGAIVRRIDERTKGKCLKKKSSHEHVCSSFLDSLMALKTCSIGHSWLSIFSPSLRMLFTLD